MTMEPEAVTTPHSPRGRKAKRSILDRKVSAREATAKGTTGDGIVAEMLRQLGWSQVADLDRCYPGADLIAVCACQDKHLLWSEVKAYPLGGIEDDSWEHLQNRALEVMTRPRERFALFTYQKSDRAGRPPKGSRASWWVCIKRDWDNPLPFISAKAWLTPPCAPPHPTGIDSNPPSPHAESRAVPLSGPVSAGVLGAARPAMPSLVTHEREGYITVSHLSDEPHCSICKPEGV